MIKVLIADDHALFRQGIISMLNDSANIEIVGQAENGKELVRLFFELNPDVVISDINMPVKSGPDAIKSIINTQRHAKVLFLSQFTGDDYLYSVVKSGALGIISKNCMKDELIQAIQNVNEGKKYFNNKSEIELEQIIKRFDSIYTNNVNYKENALTSKEEEVIKLIGEGLTSEQIAEKMHLSRRTIDTHRYRIIGTLGLKSWSELVRYAVLKNVAQNKENIMN